MNNGAPTQEIAVPSNLIHAEGHTRCYHSRSIGYTRAEPPKWMHWQPLPVTGMVLTPGQLFVAGPPDVVVPGDSLGAFEGRAGGKLRVVRTSSGETLREYDLPSSPVFDGLIAAYGRLYLATLDGKITCMGK
ncbi:MAG: hypothetical protein EA424_06230 [Planctomycetaceae bacterium]|nr:MAG: hypothetical protein EA424_06230 [Planctomycetaceae bacterium]